MFSPKSLASAGRPSTVPTDPTPYSASGRRLFCDWGRRVGTECRLCGSIADDGNPRRSANRKAQAFLSSVHEKLVERDRLLIEWEEHCREGVGGGADGRASTLNPLTSIPRKASFACACAVRREHPDYPVSDVGSSPKSEGKQNDVDKLGNFQSLGSPRALRQRLGETWEGPRPLRKRLGETWEGIFSWTGRGKRTS